MRKFGGLKKLDVIAALCRRDGVTLDTADYDRGGDYVVLTGGGACVQLDMATGVFHGHTPEGDAFHSSVALNDGEPWFESLLMFFYEPLPSAPASPFVMADPEHASPEDLDAQHNPGSRAEFVPVEHVAITVTAVAPSQSAPEVVKPAEAPSADAPAIYPNPFGG